MIMYGKILNTLLILSFLFLSNCTTSTSNFPLHTRQSFVKIEKTFKFDLCPDDPRDESCKLNAGIITGSGSIVKRISKGAYVLTAGHVCDSSTIIPLEMRQDGNLITTIEAIDLKFNRYYAQIVNINSEMDTCMLYVRDLSNKPVNFSNFEPNIGDKAYNVAAPTGVFYVNTVPLLEGLYMGVRERDLVALYTVPAAGGSSGSPIFDVHGDLIGMIHSVNRYFPMITVSPTLTQIKRFVFNSVMKHKRELILIQKRMRK